VRCQPARACCRCMGFLLPGALLLLGTCAAWCLMPPIACRQPTSAADAQHGAQALRDRSSRAATRIAEPPLRSSLHQLHSLPCTCRPAAGASASSTTRMFANTTSAASALMRCGSFQPGPAGLDSSSAVHAPAGAGALLPAAAAAGAAVALRAAHQLASPLPARPPQEFRRTKNDCGDCPCIHDDNCRKQYEELDDRSKDRYG